MRLIRYHTGSYYINWKAMGSDDPQASWFSWCFGRFLTTSLRKHAYSNILKFLPTKNENFQIKNSDNFLYFCSKHRLWYSLEPPRRGGSNEYPRSMFLSRNKKNNIYPCKPLFYYMKVGFKGGGQTYRHVFTMCSYRWSTRRCGPSFIRSAPRFGHVIATFPYLHKWSSE